MTEIGQAPPGESIALALPLAADEAGLQRFALAVTTPGSPWYADYRPISWLAHRYGASASTRRRVLDYLRNVGAAELRVDATGLFADATMSASLAERLFSTSLAHFRGAHAARFTAPTATVSVPSALRGLVTGVVGLDTRSLYAPHQAHLGADSLARARAAAQPASGYFPASGTAGGCAAGRRTHGFTPNQYLTAYGYDALHGAGITGQNERVALIEIDGFKARDIRSFASCFGLRVPEINGFGIGVKKPLAPGGEATLDLEVLDAAAPGLKAIDVYEAHADAVHTLRALTAPLQNPGFKPQVISASLGLCEADTAVAVGRPGIAAAEGALAEAAASGISFLASSGDSGSADCIAGGVPVPRLDVNYPSSSPWVTGVGGTNLILNPGNTIAQQLVWNDTNIQPGSAGGGGLSSRFLRPGYQVGTVVPNRRAVPDVSMLADVAPGYAIYCSVGPPDCNPASPWTTIGGTSASTPLLAGGFALVDQELRMQGRQDLGLANPLLYQAGTNPSTAPQVFSDVVQIGNDVGPFIDNHQPLGCCAAAPGYDEASGWGSVNLANFAALARVTQPKIVGVELALSSRQHPIRAHRILATVSCSGACVMGAYATVTIRHSRGFRVFSSLYHLQATGSKTVPIKFSAGQLRMLRGARANHHRIVAGVVGAIVDAGFNIERRTAAVRLMIKG
jgi:kumamolisin